MKLHQIKPAIAVLLLSSFSVQASLIPSNPVVHTPPKDQGYVGFCWSYTVNGLMESEALKKGDTLDLSEEYVGFYHMFETLKSNLDNIRIVARKNEPRGWFGKKVVDSFRKIVLKMIFAPSEGVATLTRSMDVVRDYGTVPESVFSTKVTKDQAGLQKRIGDFIATKMIMKTQVDAYKADTDLLFTDFAAAFGAQPPRPTDSFKFSGQTFTPVSFAKSYIKFNPEDYTEVGVNSTNHFSVLKSIKSSLDKGDAVQLGYLIFDENFKKVRENGVFTESTCPNGYCSKLAGGHAVLAVNYLQKKAMNPASQSAQPIESIVIKNSWGATGVNVVGSATSVDSEKGYYQITQGYLALPNKSDPAAIPPTDPEARKKFDADIKKKAEKRAWMVVLKKKYL